MVLGGEPGSDGAHYEADDGDDELLIRPMSEVVAAAASTRRASPPTPWRAMFASPGMAASYWAHFHQIWSISLPFCLLRSSARS
jgi:hypothetical protein